jgi:hypothetical protein
MGCTVVGEGCAFALGETDKRPMTAVRAAQEVRLRRVMYEEEWKHKTNFDLNGILLCLKLTRMTQNP